MEHARFLFASFIPGASKHYPDFNRCKKWEGELNFNTRMGGLVITTHDSAYTNRFSDVKFNVYAIVVGVMKLGHIVTREGL